MPEPSASGTATVILPDPPYDLWTRVGEASISTVPSELVNSKSFTFSYPSTTMYIPLPLDASAAVDVSRLYANLASLTTSSPSVPVFRKTNGAATPEAISDSSQNLPANTLFVPWVPGATTSIDFNDRVGALKSIASLDSSTATSPSAPNSSSTFNSTTPNINGTRMSNSTITHAEFTGGIVGGTIGGLAAGVVLALLFVWCIRRQRSKTTGEHGGEVAVTHRAHDDFRGADLGKEMQVFASHNSVTGWQKHLPQDKDDGTIARAVRMLYDQIQIYAEGFYRVKSAEIPGEAVAALRELLTEDFPLELIRGPSGSSLLEGIMVRWIVRRISLRSKPSESLLPLDFTRVPAQNGWHMEVDGQTDGYAVGPKRGTQQALSQWRMLTGFLHLQPKGDREFRKQLDVKIDQAVQMMTQAFFPWEARDVNIADRNASLRKILEEASDLGVLLFVQHSAFAFDWSSQDQSVTIYPALVKKLDELGKPPASASVLVAAKRMHPRTSKHSRTDEI